MLDHLFDIDGNSRIEFEKIDFAVQELRVDGEVVWQRRFGLAPELNLDT